MGFATAVGLATTVGTTVGSFAQAAAQNQKMKKAEAAAAKAMKEAEKRFGVNFFDALSIQKDIYDSQRREMTTQAALATQQLTEGDPRALAAGVGRVQLAQQKGQEDITLKQLKEQSDLEKLQRSEDARLEDVKLQKKLLEAEGAQLAARDAEEAQAAAIKQGMAGVTSIGEQTSKLIPLFAKPTGVVAFNRIRRQAARNPDIDLSTLDISDSKALEAAGIKLTPKQFASIPSDTKTLDAFEEYLSSDEFYQSTLMNNPMLANKIKNLTNK